MARTPRQIFPQHLTEITLKTFQARFLLTPNRLVNRLIIGVIGRAQRLYGLSICAIVVVSNHLHLLIVPDSETQVERFCQFLASNISKEIGRLRRWTGGIFHNSRYKDIVVTHEELAQVSRLRYSLSHGVKEGLVRRIWEWPGIHCAHALLRGVFQLTGEWVDRKAYSDARRAYRRSRLSRRHRRRWRKPIQADFTSTEVIVLSKLPVWAHLSDDEYRQQILQLVESIHEEYEELRRQVPKNAPARIKAQDPEFRPAATKKDPKPFCHAASRTERARFHELRHAFVEVYWSASALLRQGQIGALELFPPGSFLPPLGLIPLRCGLASARAPG